MAIGRSARRAALLCALAPGALGAQQPPATPTFQALVFGDVVYLATEREVPEGFILGQLVGHANAALSERLGFFGEVSATGRPNGYAIEVERVILRYDFGDRLKASVGRYHTPILHWNTAYHHGAWLQTSVARPELIKFGSRFLPVHFVGAMAEGTFPSGPLGLSYRAGVGNGRAANIARAGDAGDVNGRAAFVGSLSARPTVPFGLILGVSGYLDRVSLEGGAQADERILSLHGVWERGPPELMAEYVRIWHDPVGSGASEASEAFYAQAAARLPGALRAWKPYLRYERIEIPALDPVFGELLDDYEAALVGVRYDFAALAALKAEARREEFGDGGWDTSLYVQASFAVPATGGAGS